MIVVPREGNTIFFTPFFSTAEEIAQGIKRNLKRNPLITALLKCQTDGHLSEEEKDDHLQLLHTSGNPTIYVGYIRIVESTLLKYKVGSIRYTCGVGFESWTRQWTCSPTSSPSFLSRSSINRYICGNLGKVNCSTPDVTLVLCRVNGFSATTNSKSQQNRDKPCAAIAYAANFTLPLYVVLPMNHTFYGTTS